MAETDAPTGQYDDVDYMRGFRAAAPSSSLLRSTSKYLNSPVLRDIYCNEGLRLPGPDVITTTLLPEFYETIQPLIDHEGLERMFREDAARRPDLAEWLAERYSSPIGYDQVKDSAEGTLGHGIKQLLDQGFQLYFGRLGPAASDFDYVRKRRAEIHDLEHIITGLPTSMAGELALYVANMTFTYAYFQPHLAKEIALISSFLFTSWTLRTSLHTPEVMPAVCDAMAKGVELGKGVRRPIFMEKWEDYLDWQVVDLRRHFGIPELTGFVGDWEWEEGKEPRIEVSASP